MTRILPCLIAILLLLVACSPETLLRDESLLSDESLLTGEPCAAPCFRGITPGETSWVDALTIIEDEADFDNIQTQGPAEGSSVIQASWQQGADSPVCCQMVTEDGEIVSLVFLRTAPTHTLDDLFGIHGEPTWLTGQEISEDQAVVSLVYPDQPMIVYAFVAGTAEGQLAAGSEVVGALYMEAGSVDLLVQTTELHRWEGYGSYSG
ncbi:MAG: hypothetical protein J4G17_06645 [Anaerolineae bacterium]|nr:hypothetical protein [Anaerolineae bacterium]